MKTIKSFTVDHTKLGKGFYISRIDGDVVTYDLRFRVPNAGEYLDDTTMHTIEHMLATFTRNSEIGDEVVYFGPMGCRTGFYFLTRDSVAKERAFAVIKQALADTVAHSGEVFGASEKECGNFRDLDLDSARKECRDYLAVLKNVTEILNYDEVNEK